VFVGFILEKMTASATATEQRGVVVLAEDDADVRTSIEELLEERGYLVLSARDGTSALRRMRGVHGPVVALVDLAMRGMDGWDLIKNMKTDPDLARIPIIVCTASMLAGVSGADAIVHKPFAGDALVALIEQHCR
jgi:chemosensory pili system protein ChpA (sensor histidine kinase/response regulator)